MDGIKIEVNGNVVRVIERPARITAGTVGLPVEFAFDSPWEGLDKTAVFRAGHVCKIVERLETEAVVPWEVLGTPGFWLSIGVYGVNKDGTVAIPTIWANVCAINVGANPDGDPATDPTLPIYQKLVNVVGDPADLQTDDKDNLVNAINEVRSISMGGGVKVDDTLSLPGVAADAAAVGKALEEIDVTNSGAVLIAAGEENNGKYLSVVNGEATWVEAQPGGSDNNDTPGNNEGTENIEGLSEHINNKDNPHNVTAEQIGAVPITRTINGKALNQDIALTAADVGARPSTWVPSPATIGAVPTTRTVNNKALSGNITLTASDVGARPSSWTPSATAVGAVSGNPGAMFDDHVLTVVNGKATWVQPAVGFYSAFSLDKDSTYTDCFYRQVFNADVGKVEKEWLNPPMVVNTEYRTVERHKTKPVYTMLIKMGTAPEVGSALIIEIPDAKRIVRAEAYADDGVYYKIIPRKDSAYEVTLSVGSTVASRGDSYVEINVISGSLSGYDCFAQVWYIKN